MLAYWIACCKTRITENAGVAIGLMLRALRKAMVTNKITIGPTPTIIEIS